MIDNAAPETPVADVSGGSVTPEATTPAAPESLQDALAAVQAKHEKSGVSEAAETVDAESAESEETASENKRKRDAGGRFAQKDVDESTTTDVEAKPEDAGKDIPVPVYVPKEIHEHYGKVPEEVRKWVDATVRQRDTWATRADNFKKAVDAWKPMRDTLEFYSDVLSDYDNKPLDAVSDLLQLRSDMNTNPTATLRRLMEVHNVDPVDFALAVTEGGHKDDGETQRQLSAYQRRERFEQGRQEDANRAAEQRQDAMARTAFDEFVGGQDPGLMRVIGQDFKRQIDALENSMPAGTTYRQLFEAALEAAKLVNPQTRNRILAEERERAKAEFERTARAARAKAINVNGSPHNPGAFGSMAEALAAVAEKHRRAGNIN